VRIIVFWKGDGLFDNFEYDVPIASSQISFRALTKGHTAVDAPRRSVPPF
jgi:hypothetical protein